MQLDVDIAFSKTDWLRCKAQNIDLIKGNCQQIMMAQRVLVLCEEKLAEFPPEPKLAELTQDTISPGSTSVQPQKDVPSQ